jgi:hypothetical protein
MHDIGWDSIVVEETNNEGRNDVTSEQGLYFQLGLDNQDDGREDDSSASHFGNSIPCCRRANLWPGWRSIPALNPKMRRGLSVLLVSWKSGKNTRTHKVLEWFGPPERNTLLHCVMYCLRACMNL